MVKKWVEMGKNWGKWVKYWEEMGKKPLKMGKNGENSKKWVKNG